MRARRRRTRRGRRRPAPTTLATPRALTLGYECRAPRAGVSVSPHPHAAFVRSCCRRRRDIVASAKHCGCAARHHLGGASTGVRRGRMARWCAICGRAGPARTRLRTARARRHRGEHLPRLCRLVCSRRATRRALGALPAAITSCSRAASMRMPPSRRTLGRLTALRQLGRTPDESPTWTVETHPRGLTLTEVDPPTVLSAKFSMLTVMAAVARRSGGQSSFVPDACASGDRAAALRGAAKLSAAHRPLQRACVTWCRAMGTVWGCGGRNARGGAHQPFSTDDARQESN